LASEGLVWVGGSSGVGTGAGAGVTEGAGIGAGTGVGGSTGVVVMDGATGGGVVGGVIEGALTGAVAIAGGMALLLASSTSCLEPPRALARACSSRDARL